MHPKKTILVSTLFFFGLANLMLGQTMLVNAPDSGLAVSCMVKDGKPVYTVRLSNETLINESPLGLVCREGDFSRSLKVNGVSENKVISDRYTLVHGKQRVCEYRANQRVMTLENDQGQSLDIVFQVSNTGVAFCYRITQPNSGSYLVTSEATGFTFPDGTTTWLHPLHDAKTGWQQTFPSYESHYAIEQPIGEPSTYAAGWAFPALFRVGEKGWVLISETDVDGTYCGTRLAQHSDNGLYRIAFPQEKEHRGPEDPVSPTIQLPFESPWRILVVSHSLSDIVESTLATDLASPSKVADTSFIKPGRAAWSWLRYDSGGTELTRLEEYLEMAGDLGWEYQLVDCEWDRMVGYDKIAELAQKAKDKGVTLILWYNSNGEWNTAPFTPQDKMHIAEVRRAEFKRIKEMGIGGVKVDFFGGDKQVTMQLYMDILKDAAEFNILCNFHGATLPRGWQRTWPNMVTTEAVMGMEFCTFEQANADQQPQHCCVLGFTRNVVAPMDFTPTVISRRIRGVRRVTTPAFELALPVIFESGIQHFGLAPFEAEALPDFAVDYLKAVPTAWDRTRFIGGYPAKDMILARQKDDTWYIAGINGENTEKTLTLDLSFLPDSLKGLLITDGSENDELQTQDLNAIPDLFEVKVQPYGGFVLQAK